MRRGGDRLFFRSFNNTAGLRLFTHARRNCHCLRRRVFARTGHNGNRRLDRRCLGTFYRTGDRFHINGNNIGTFYRDYYGAFYRGNYRAFYEAFSRTF